MTPCIGGIAPCTGYSNGRPSYTPLIKEPDMPIISVLSLSFSSGALYANWAYTSNVYRDAFVYVHFIVRNRTSLEIESDNVVPVTRVNPGQCGTGLTDAEDYWLYVCSKASIWQSVWQAFEFTFVDTPAPPPPVVKIVDGGDFIMDDGDYVIDA